MGEDTKPRRVRVPLDQAKRDEIDALWEQSYKAIFLFAKERTRNADTAIEVGSLVYEWICAGNDPWDRAGVPSFFEYVCGLVVKIGLKWRSKERLHQRRERLRFGPKKDEDESDDGGGDDDTEEAPASGAAPESMLRGGAQVAGEAAMLATLEERLDPLAREVLAMVRKRMTPAEQAPVLGVEVGRVYDAIDRIKRAADAVRAEADKVEARAAREEKIS